MEEDGEAHAVCECVCVPLRCSAWALIVCLLSAGQSEGKMEYLLILATHLFSWKSLDCFCSAPCLPLSVSLPLMKLQMNWSTYWLLSRSSFHFCSLIGLLPHSLTPALPADFSITPLLPLSRFLDVFMLLGLHLKLPFSLSLLSHFSPVLFSTVFCLSVYFTIHLVSFSLCVSLIHPHPWE